MYWRVFVWLISCVLSGRVWPGLVFILSYR